MKYLVTVNNERYEVEVEKVDSRSSRMLRRGAAVEERAAAPAAAPAPAAPAPKAAPAPAASGDAKKVVSPMPGVILDINVNVGDKVEPGQAVVILEAMKMENEIVSEFSGVVSAIKVKKGENVDTDSVLVEIK